MGSSTPARAARRLKPGRRPIGCSPCRRRTSRWRPSTASRRAAGGDRLPARGHRRLRRRSSRRWRSSCAAPARRPARRSPSTTDSFGYRWMILHDPDVEDLVVGVNAVSDALAVGGYGDRVLARCSPSRTPRTAAVLHLQLQARLLVPVRARRAASRPRDAERELQIKAMIEQRAADRARARALVPALGDPDLMTEIHAKVLSIHDVAPAPAPCIEGVDWRPLRDELGVTAFGMNAYVGAEPGTVVVEPHDEVDTGHEEVYAVIAGSARFKLDGQTFDVAAPGFVEARLPRRAARRTPSRAGRSCSPSALRRTSRSRSPSGRPASTSSGARQQLGGVGARRDADVATEVVAEVGLVEVAQVLGKRGEVGGLTGPPSAQPPRAADSAAAPTRAHADVRGTGRCSVRTDTPCRAATSVTRRSGGPSRIVLAASTTVVIPASGAGRCARRNASTRPIRRRRRRRPLELGSWRAEGLRERHHPAGQLRPRGARSRARTRPGGT